MIDDDTERTHIEALARRAYPEEACGVVMTRPGTRVLVPCRNDGLTTTTRSFNISVKDLVRIIELQRNGFALDTIWHSHPDEPARFSTVDEAFAMLGDEPQFPETTYKVVSVVRGEIREWDAVVWSADTRRFEHVRAWPRLRALARAA